MKPSCSSVNASQIGFTDVDVSDKIARAADWVSISSSEWGDELCEFEREQSDYVKRMFEQVDNFLYDNGHHSHPQREELDDWLGRFSHLRVVGKSAFHIPVRDRGVHAVARDATHSLEEKLFTNRIGPTDLPRRVSSMSLDPKSHEENDYFSKESPQEDSVVPLAATRNFSEDVKPRPKQSVCSAKSKTLLVHHALTQCNHSSTLYDSLPDCNNVLMQHLILHFRKDFSTWLRGELNRPDRIGPDDRRINDWPSGSAQSPIVSAAHDKKRGKGNWPTDVDRNVIDKTEKSATRAKMPQIANGVKSEKHTRSLGQPVDGFGNFLLVSSKALQHRERSHKDDFFGNYSGKSPQKSTDHVIRTPPPQFRSGASWLQQPDFPPSTKPRLSCSYSFKKSCTSQGQFSSGSVCNLHHDLSLGTQDIQYFNRLAPVAKNRLTSATHPPTDTDISDLLKHTPSSFMAWKAIPLGTVELQFDKIQSKCISGCNSAICTSEPKLPTYSHMPLSSTSKVLLPPISARMCNPTRMSPCKLRISQIQSPSTFKKDKIQYHRVHPVSQFQSQAVVSHTGPTKVMPDHHWAQRNNSSGLSEGRRYERRFRIPCSKNSTRSGFQPSTVTATLSSRPISSSLPARPEKRQAGIQIDRSRSTIPLHICEEFAHHRESKKNRAVFLGSKVCGSDN